MAVVTFSTETYQRVFEIAQTTRDVRVLKRAQALLWLSDGDTVDEVAERLQVSVRTVYRWVDYFMARRHQPVAQWLSDAPRSGRPAQISERIEPLIERLIADGPQDYGYQAAVWTAPLLQAHLHQVHHLTASARSINRTLARLGLRWKRPRHSLARRSPTWRQAKGGFNVASTTAPAR